MTKLREAGALKCVDWDTADLFLTGGINSDGKMVFDVAAHPCHFRETSVNGDEDNIREDCEVDQEVAI